ncbi:hypothetical protein Leryth_023240 [Lithospermum erythrorhizon]|nr:hypothetical protein Leryth_023240 [Lithospermum erythrorhizon]
MYCGVCHSDLHMLKNEWKMTRYPVVPGHEIVGVVTEIGKNIKKVKVGDKVGVGVIVGSCHKCDNCANDQENYCPQNIQTYNSIDVDGTITYGGYSDIMVANEHFVIRWPDSMPMEYAPLLCAGITTYSPLRHFGLDKSGQRVGIVGLGGLGHMAVKFAKAFGAKVTVISTTIAKKQEAIGNLGADEFVISKDPEQMRAIAGTLDGIIDTVSAKHPLAPLLMLLKTDGRLVMVGLPENPLEFPAFALLSGRRTIAGSAFGGLKETQEMIDFAAKHSIFPEIEIIPVDYVNKAMDRLLKSDVKYRFVLDVANTLKA